MGTDRLTRLPSGTQEQSADRAQTTSSPPVQPGGFDPVQVPVPSDGPILGDEHEEAHGGFATPAEEGVPTGPKEQEHVLPGP